MTHFLGNNLSPKYEKNNYWHIIKLPKIKMYNVIFNFLVIYYSFHWKYGSCEWWAYEALPRGYFWTGNPTSSRWTPNMFGNYCWYLIKDANNCIYNIVRRVKMFTALGIFLRTPTFFTKILIHFSETLYTVYIFTVLNIRYNLYKCLFNNSLRSDKNYKNMRIE